MKKISLALISFSFVAVACGQTNSAPSRVSGLDTGSVDTVVTCHSMDVTFRPFYNLEVSLLDVTHPGYYHSTIKRTNDLEGTSVTTLRKEGPGQKTADSLAVEFGEYKNGTWQPSGETLSVTKLANGFLKGELILSDDDFPAELVCEKTSGGLPNQDDGYLKDMESVDAARDDMVSKVLVGTFEGMNGIGIGGNSPSDTWISVFFETEVARSRFEYLMVRYPEHFTNKNGLWLYAHTVDGFPGAITTFVRVKLQVIGPIVIH